MNADFPAIETKHTEAEASLRVSEIRYRRLFECARDGILILDSATGKILDANPFMSERLGYTLEELTGKNLWEIGLLGDVASSQAATSELQTVGYIRYEHLPLVSKQGVRVDVEFVCNTYMEGNQKVAQCNIRDITERVRTEAEMSRQSHLINLAHDAILMWNTDGTICYWNAGAAALYGWTKVQALGQDAHNLLKTKFPKPLCEFLADFRRDGSWEGELVQMCRDGKQIDVNSRWVLDRGENGESETTLEINQDITDRKRKEKLQVRSAEELTLLQPGTRTVRLRCQPRSSGTAAPWGATSVF